ncbi:MAG: undecaprenyldiphospho-muramoylpentapeptide beta-N-acetylglucosaminyltransferase [Verrucomicrobiota bacterium]|jgi:UDP-N-acetylglucosamine--N-acetylmuramyl-(pentapeptide) pyrophosphoryl-undecaprenol N-acetylglucosamine transferase|nr:undecaprenyldiphospho-muramoylpentapeptide beta-N-acetylglucosaminyltransferase [Verrucomicrobiota bacterium]
MKPLPKRIAIACGGTGGHLFPGLAVGDALVARGCEVTLLVSSKEVDQTAVKSAYGMEVESLPVIGLSRNLPRFAASFWSSLGQCRKLFGENRPDAVLAMGGFTSAPPVIAGKLIGARIFLHEANAIPGRAVKLLAPLADEVFVQFPAAMPRVLSIDIRATGLPVRAAMEPIEKADARTALGLADDQPVLLVMGGSQGARSINQALIESLPRLAKALPDLQFIHLTGTGSVEPVRQAYDALGLSAVVRPFLTEMEYALGAADLALSRSGASSLAEFSAMELPAILIPYPTAVDDHQRLNARSFVDIGAARCFHQKQLTPNLLVSQLSQLFGSPARLEAMAGAMKQWKSAQATGEVVQRIFEACGWEDDAGDELMFALPRGKEAAA